MGNIVRHLERKVNGLEDSVDCMKQAVPPVMPVLLVFLLSVWCLERKNSRSCVAYMASCCPRCGGYPSLCNRGTPQQEGS